MIGAKVFRPAADVVTAAYYGGTSLLPAQPDIAVLFGGLPLKQATFCAQHHNAGCYACFRRKLSPMRTCFFVFD
jgi:hypothetical protein